MNKFSIISIDHISQLVPGLAALRYNNIKNNTLKKPLLVLSKPHLTINDIKLTHIKALISSYPHSVFICGYSLFKYPKLMTYLPVRLRAKFLTRKLKKYPIDEIFFSHDLSSDFWNQVLMQAFPKAKRICYGDALGLVYSQNYFSQLMYQIVNKNKIIFHNILARIKRKLIYPGKKNQLQAQEAILAIPCDPGKDFKSMQVICY